MYKKSCFELPPPVMPAWLDSVCSQIDIFSDTSLPQVFTPRDGNVHEAQQLCRKPFSETRNETTSSTLPKTNNTSFFQPQPWQSFQSSTQFEADSSRDTQPWPTLQPASERAAPSKETRNLWNDGAQNMASSQPWPSCEVRKPASQSCRITDSRLTRCSLTSASPGWKMPRNNVIRTLKVPSHLPAPPDSPVYSPITVSTQNSNKFYAPPNLKSGNGKQDLQQNYRKRNVNEKFASANQKPGSVTCSRSSATYNLKSKSVHNTSNKMSSLSSQRMQQSFSINTASADNSRTPVSSSHAHDAGSVASLRARGAVAPKEDGCHNSATHHIQKDLNPYTPAQINFQGADGKGTKLRCVEEIPTPYCNIFPFPYFNAVQSMAFDQLLYTDSSVVVSAPTGSGKTALFELAIVRLLLCAHLPLRDIKVVYIGPMKSLCGERVDDWQKKLSPLGLQCMELTGDSDLSDFTSLQHVQVICTTPEKWDSVTRRWKDNRHLFQSICLLCIDEVHVVGDSQRGATVEAVITRMKMVQTQSAGTLSQPMRFVAVSATLPNTEDIAEWLSSLSNPASVFKLGEEYRPVRLQRVVLGYPFSEGSSEFRFDLNLTYKLQSVIDSYSHGKPTLVFCSSRKSCHQTAEMLVKRRWGHSSYILPQYRQDINAAATRLQERKLCELLVNGVGVHHAGLEVNDRKLIEELFRSGKLAVLISTSTLSVGVNLPAHLVIVKATHMYIMGVAREYSDQQVLQMIGRAGRPQFDTSATVVIMTKIQLKPKYEALVNGTQVIESMLHKNLTEHVNVEVVLNTITDMADTASWLSHTLLHVRATKNPRHYGLPAGLDTQQVEKKLQDLCMTAVNRLNSLQLVSVDPDTAMTSPTERGRLMARYCLEFQTMKLLSNIPMKSSMEHLIPVIASCPEFLDIQLRTSEKKTLNNLNKNKHQETIRYPMKGKIKTKQMKVNSLMQAGLGCLHIQDYSLSQDLLKIFRVGQRVTKCLMELQWLGVDYTTLLRAVELCKAFKARLWPDSKHVARQLEGIGPTISQALVQAGLTSFQLLEAADPHHLELVVNRHPPFGNRVHDVICHLPRYELVIQQVKNHQAASAHLVICVSMLNAEDVNNSSTCGKDHQLVFIIGDEDNSIVFKWKLSDRMLLPRVWRRDVYVKRAMAGPSLYVGLISLDWAGLDIHTEYQPIYTTSFHPAGRAGQTQPMIQAEASRAQPQNKRSRTTAATTAREKKGQDQAQQNSKTAGQKTGNKIQQQLDVMHSKLQQFWRPVPRPAEKLCHNRTTSYQKASAVSPEDTGHNQTNRQVFQNTGPFGSGGSRLVISSSASTLPAAACQDDTDFSPEIDLQTEPWGDLVSDFWDEGDFDPPTSKVPKVTKCHKENEAGAHAASDAVAGISTAPTTVNNVTFRSQPDIKVFGNTQNQSQGNSFCSKYFTALGRGKAVSTDTSADFTINNSTVGINSTSRLTHPHASIQNESASKNLHDWKRVAVPEKATSSCTVFSKDNSDNPSADFVNMMSSRTPSSPLQRKYPHGHSTETSNGAKAPEIGQDMNSAQVKPQNVDMDGDKSEANKQHAAIDSKWNNGVNNKENVSSRSGSGWEHLQLYHSNRELVGNQGDTLESSEGREDSMTMSQPSDFNCPWQPISVSPVRLPQCHSVIGKTLPIVREAVQNSYGYKQESLKQYPECKFTNSWHPSSALSRTPSSKISMKAFTPQGSSHLLASVATENLLEGIF